MSALEEAIAGVLDKYSVPSFLHFDDGEGVTGGSDRGDLVGALAEVIENTVQVAYLGHSYRDVLTGFTGAAVSVWYKVGSLQVQLARVGNEGNIQEEWIETARLEPVEDVAAAPTGFGR